MKLIPNSCANCDGVITASGHVLLIDQSGATPSNSSAHQRRLLDEMSSPEQLGKKIFNFNSPVSTFNKAGNLLLFRLLPFASATKPAANQYEKRLA